MIPATYRVTIDNSAGTFTGTAGTDDYGFADYMDTEAWRRAGSEPADVNEARDKERAFARWQRIVDVLADGRAPVALTPLANTGASVSTPPSTLEFELILPTDEPPRTVDEITGTVLEDEDAVRRLVARALAEDFRVRLHSWDPPGYGRMWWDEILDVRTPLSGSLATRLGTAEGKITVTRTA